MNLFRFLKSTKGAIKPLNALIISGAAGAVFAYTVNTAADHQIQAERAVRTLTSIEGTAPQEGMHRQGGLLTSINVRDGRSELATAEERAAMKGTSALDRYEANQRALGNMDSSLGRMAEFSKSEGLNVGNRDAVQSSARFSVGNPNAAAGDAVVDGGYTRSAASQGESGAQGGQNQLPSASITRASGNSFGGAPGAVSGGITAQGGRTAGTEGPQRLSGAMPGGSNIVSQRGLDGALAQGGTSSFGRDRNGRTTRGRNIGAERNELRDIVKKSAVAAANTRASANEGGRAFLASNQSSGGITVDGAGEDPTASSGDLAPTDKKLKAVGNKLKDIENEQDERGKLQNALKIQMLATILGSIGMIIAGAVILTKLDAAAAAATVPAVAAAIKLKRWLIAAAMMAVVTAANAWLMLRAAKFIDRYATSGGVGLAKLAAILAPVMVAGMVYTAINPTGWSKLGATIWAKVKAAFEPIGLVLGQVTNSVLGLIKF